MTELPGPPQIRNYTGAEVLAETHPPYEITLDAGAFRAVWEAAEAGAKQRQGTKGQEAFQRAVVVFREAYWAMHAEELAAITVVKPTKPKVVRKVAPPKTIKPRKT